jgi:G protein beta subunit-like protein
VWKINEEGLGLPRFQAVTKFQAHNKYLTRCLLSPDVKYGNFLEFFVGFPSEIRDRYLATCSADTTVKIWSITSNYEFKLEKGLQGHQRWVWDCAFSADSAYLVTGEQGPEELSHPIVSDAPQASSDHTARLWEMTSGETVRQYNGHHKGRFTCYRRTLAPP